MCTSETSAVNDLHVNSELAPTVINDEHAHRSTAIRERVVEPAPQVIVIDDRQALLDVAGLGHGNHGAVLAHVEHAVLLEDGAEHALNHDRRRWVADEAGLLVQLLGEEVDAEVAVLARVRRRGDADDLAGAALEDQQVADADVVAGDADRVRTAVALDVAHVAASADRGAGRANAGVVVALALDQAVALDHDVLAVVVVMVVVPAVEGVQDAVRGALQAAAEGVVAALVVVVAHLAAAAAALGGVDGLFGFDVHVLGGGAAVLDLDVVGCSAVLGSGVLEGDARVAALVLDVVGGAALVVVVLGREAAAVLALGYVDLGFLAGTLAFAFDVDVNFGATSWFTVTTTGTRRVSMDGPGRCCPMPNTRNADGRLRKHRANKGGETRNATQRTGL